MLSVEDVGLVLVASMDGVGMAVGVVTLLTAIGVCKDVGWSGAQATRKIANAIPQQDL